MKRCHIFLGRFHSSACPASLFLSLLQTGKAPGGGHPRLPRGPTPTSPVLGCPILPVRLTAIDQGPPVRQYRNTSRYWLMLHHSQSHSHFIFEETEALSSLSQTMWTRLGVQSHGGRRPNSCSYSFFHPQGCERGEVLGVGNYVVPSPTAAWEAPGGEGPRMKPGWIEIIMFLDEALSKARHLPKCWDYYPGRKGRGALSL